MGGNNDITALKNLWAIDNEFLLLTLRFGYLGLTLWSIALILTIYNYSRLATRCPIDLRWFFLASASIVVGIIFIQCTVWMPQDYGFFLIWVMGGSAGLYNAHLKRQKERPKITIPLQR